MTADRTPEEPDWALPSIRERLARSEARLDVIERDQAIIRATIHDVAGITQRNEALVAGLLKAQEHGQDSNSRIEKAVEGQRVELGLHRTEAAASVLTIMAKIDDGLGRVHARVDRLVQATLVAFAIGAISLIAWLLTHPLPWAVGGHSVA